MNEHQTIGEQFACYERNKPEGWADRVASPAEQAAARHYMIDKLSAQVVDHLPQGFVEALTGWKLAVDLLDAAHHHISAGGGMELEDIVRELLRREDRFDKIAEMHRKDIGPGGMTSGLCTECGWEWPCATYDWARADSDRDPLSPWDRADDEADADAAIRETTR